MSTPAAAADPAPAGEAVKRNNRRRRPQGGRRRNKGKGVEGAEGEQREKPEYVDIPIPEELFGTKIVGVVQSIVRKAKSRFGFILIGDGVKQRSEVPRIYFNFAEFKQPEVHLRRNQEVEFMCSKDEQGRSCATDIYLTEAGMAKAVQQEEAIAKRQSEQVAAAGTGEAKPPRRPRRERIEKMVSLKIACEGKGEVKTMELDVNQPIGKLKSVCVTLFDAPVEYTVYKSNVDGTKDFLTRSLFAALEEGETILLAPAPPSGEK